MQLLITNVIVKFTNLMIRSNQDGERQPPSHSMKLALILKGEFVLYLPHCEYCLQLFDKGTMLETHEEQRVSFDGKKSIF